jgi:SAM-dependent methyltransferase
VTSHDWDAVVRAWRETPATLLLRAYSDAANRRLLERWVPTRAGRVLKTDVFDEAVAEGLAPFLARRADALVAIDASPAAVEAARRRRPELDARVADVRSLPFEDGSFDVVVSTSTLDHFQARADIDTALLELGRVLAPGGLAVVTLDNPWNPLVALRNGPPGRARSSRTTSARRSGRARSAPPSPVPASRSRSSRRCCTYRGSRHGRSGRRSGCSSRRNAWNGGRRAS